MIVRLRPMVVEIISAYLQKKDKQNKKKKVDHIIYYRDGVSESQFEEVGRQSALFALRLKQTTMEGRGTWLWDVLCSRVSIACGTCLEKSKDRPIWKCRSVSAQHLTSLLALLSASAKGKTRHWDGLLGRFAWRQYFAPNYCYRRPKTSPYQNIQRKHTVSSKCTCVNVCVCVCVCLCENETVGERVRERVCVT